MTATLIGKTWNYEYPGSRGTITYFPDQTSSYNEPGLRRGTGKPIFPACAVVGENHVGGVNRDFGRALSSSAFPSEATLLFLWIIFRCGHHQARIDRAAPAGRGLEPSRRRGRLSSATPASVAVRRDRD
jgi:hypothetical protein